MIWAQGLVGKVLVHKENNLVWIPNTGVRTALLLLCEQL